MPAKPYFFYGHRKPSQNRPTVCGGLFSNRLSLRTPPPPEPQNHQTQTVDLANWDPHLPQSPSSKSKSRTPTLSFFSPIARFILQKLRRVTPNLVAEVLKVQTDPSLASKFFHWAGKQKGYYHNFASYIAFAYCLNRNNRYRSADQLLELMESQGRPPSEKQFEILIRMHDDKNRGLRVYYVYEKMKFGIKPRVFLFNRIIDALLKTGYLYLGLSVYEDFRDAGLVKESVTFMILIKGLCKCGKIEEMLEILGRMRVNLCKPDVFAYTAMVRVLVSEGNLDEGLRVWEEMRRDGVEPDVIAYATLITCLCKCGKVEKGSELFKEKGFLIERAIYGSLVQALVKDGKVGLAFDLLKDLIDSGYRADLGIYNSLIQGLCNMKRVDKAHKLFQLTVEEGLGPDFQTVNPILASYAEAGKMDDFCELLLQMKKLGFSVIDDLSKFFSFLVEKGEGAKIALEVFKDLKVRGYFSVLSLFNEMKDLNIQPDSSTYSVAITCFVEDGDIHEACECYNMIIQMSCVPSIAAYCSLARGLCKLGEIDAATMLVRDCLASVSSGPMEFKYTLTIIHACKSCNAEKVIEVLDEMMQQGCPLDDLICCAIVSGISKYGTIEEARKIFLMLRERKLMSEANTIVYDEVLIEHTKKKTADLVRSGLKFFGLESKLKAKGTLSN
ncbi:hypothetical protein UlMin_007437 [Ulmus minor]